MINPYLQLLKEDFEERQFDLEFIKLIDKELHNIRSIPINEDRMPDQDEYEAINYLISKRAQANYILYSAKNF